MQEEIRQQVLSRVQRDYGLKHRSGTPYMRGGKCPHCGKKELYTSYEKPWVLRCGRQAKCGQEVRVRDLYDDLFDDYSKANPQTPQAPTLSSAPLWPTFGHGTVLMTGSEPGPAWVQTRICGMAVSWQFPHGPSVLIEGCGHRAKRM